MTEKIMKEISDNIENLKVNAVEDFDFYLGLSIILSAFDKYLLSSFCLILAVVCFFKEE